MSSFKTNFITNALGGTALFLATAISLPAAAQQLKPSMSDTSVSLGDSCKNLDSIKGRKSCQGAFELFANELRIQQINAATAPHYERFGLEDDPIMVFIDRPTKESYATIEVLNGSCKDIAKKKPDQGNASGRLDDGSYIGTLRIAERALVCAKNAQMVSEVTKAPFAFGLATVLNRTAEKVIPQVNFIADTLPVNLIATNPHALSQPSLVRR